MGLLSESCPSVTSQKEYWAPLLKPQHQDWQSFEDLDLLNSSHSISVDELDNHHITIQIVPFQQQIQHLDQQQVIHKTNIKKLIKMLVKNHRNGWSSNHGLLKNSCRGHGIRHRRSAKKIKNIDKISNIC